MGFLPYTRQIIAACFLSVGLTSQAAVVHNVDNGKLIGATGVEVGGVFYDVAFRDGTFASVFQNVIPTFHDTFAEAEAFTQALINTVFVDLGSAETAYDGDPSLTAGCVSLDICNVITPYALRTFEFDAATFTNLGITVPAADEFSFNTYELQVDLASSPTATFAVFTPSVSAVPEPSTYAMLASGVLILAGFSRRSNRV